MYTDLITKMPTALITRLYTRLNNEVKIYGEISPEERRFLDKVGGLLLRLGYSTLGGLSDLLIRSDPFYYRGKVYEFTESRMIADILMEEFGLKK